MAGGAGFGAGMLSPVVVVAGVDNMELGASEPPGEPGGEPGGQVFTESLTVVGSCVVGLVDLLRELLPDLPDIP